MTRGMAPAGAWEFAAICLRRAHWLTPRPLARRRRILRTCILYGVPGARYLIIRFACGKPDVFGAPWLCLLVCADLWGL